MYKRAKIGRSSDSDQLQIEMSRDNKVKLISSDHKTFEVDELVANESQTVKMMIEAVGTENAIPLPNVSSKILGKVIEYCEWHVEYQKSLDGKEQAVQDDEIKKWDAAFLKVNLTTLIGLIQAAHYLHIENLTDRTCQKVADMMKGRTPEEIRRKFNIKNDFTPEEEAEVMKENAWAFR